MVAKKVFIGLFGILLLLGIVPPLPQLKKVTLLL